MSHLRRMGAVVATAAIALVAGTLSPARADAAAPPLPTADPFYTYDGGSLADQPPGAVLGGPRTVDILMMSLLGPAPTSGTQLLYRTTDELGNPSQTVTTVFEPSGTSKGIVDYLSYYDGLGPACSPSYTMQGGGAGIGQEGIAISMLVNAGYTVTVPDFEGEDLHWAAGHESGKSALDAIRATEAYLGAAPATTEVAMVGYSGGSIAGEWASELAPSYAPELDLIGTAIGGIPVDLGHILSYVDGTQDWAGVIPAALVSLGRAFDVDFTPYLSPAGVTATQDVADGCILDFTKSQAGVTISDLVKPEYADFLHIPVVADILKKLTMGTAGTPRIPMLMVNGNSDGTGDGIMIAADVKGLATQYCKAGDTVQYDELAGQNHTAAGATFMLSKVMPYLTGLFAGQAPATSCAALTAPPSKPTPPSHPTKPTKPAKPAKKAIHPRLRAHSHGRFDLLLVRAPGARGAVVRLVERVHGHQVRVARAKIGRNGIVQFRVRDRNGSAVTRYQALVRATATTKAAHTRTVRLH